MTQWPNVSSLELEWLFEFIIYSWRLYLIFATEDGKMWKIKWWCYDWCRKRKSSCCDDVDISDWPILIWSCNIPQFCTVFESVFFPLMLLLNTPESQKERLSVWTQEIIWQLIIICFWLNLLCLPQKIELIKNRFFLRVGTSSCIKDNDAKHTVILWHHHLSNQQNFCWWLIFLLRDWYDWQSQHNLLVDFQKIVIKIKFYIYADILISLPSVPLNITG